MSTQFTLPQEGHLEQSLYIFGYLKIKSKKRLMFDCIYPRISSKLLREYGWFDFYRYEKEDILPNMTESRG